jgi:2-alkyl-3-oxoalkanoate reductase
MKVAVTGASGFVGNRVVEKFYLGKTNEVVPIVRGSWGLVLPARFDLPWRVCDHFDVNELTNAFKGCEAVVHAALGAPYKDMAKAVYQAADNAGVGRLIVISSASIYNQNPAPGTTEESPLPRDHLFSYNSEKIAADKAVRRLRARGRTEVVFLMPGIVYGPRSRWIATLAKNVIERTGHVVRGGAGICNAVYVDNVVEAISLSLKAENVDGESFFISDAETVTWKEFYKPIIDAFHSDWADLINVDDPPAVVTPMSERIRERILITAESKRIQNMKPYIPAAAKKLYKAAVSSRPSKDEPVNPWEPLVEKQPEISLEMSMLQQCEYKLPNKKAERILNYTPPISFAEGMRRSVEWLAFAGYPVER